MPDNVIHTDQIPLANQTMKHGDICECNTCGFPGRFDDFQHNIKEDGNYAEFKDAIWMTEKVHEESGLQFSECAECYLK